MKKLLLSLVLLSSSLSLVASRGDYPCEDDGEKCKIIDNSVAPVNWDHGTCKKGLCCLPKASAYAAFEVCSDRFMGQYQMPRGVY